jgi:hypothetical protein
MAMSDDKQEDKKETAAHVSAVGKIRRARSKLYKGQRAGAEGFFAIGRAVNQRAAVGSRGKSNGAISIIEDLARDTDVAFSTLKVARLTTHWWDKGEQKVPVGSFGIDVYRQLPSWFKSPDSAWAFLTRLDDEQDVWITSGVIARLKQERSDLAEDLVDRVREVAATSKARARVQDIDGEVADRLEGLELAFTSRSPAYVTPEELGAVLQAIGTVKEIARRAAERAKAEPEAPEAGQLELST